LNKIALSILTVLVLFLMLWQSKAYLYQVDYIYVTEYGVLYQKLTEDGVITELEDRQLQAEKNKGYTGVPQEYLNKRFLEKNISWFLLTSVLLFLCYFIPKKFIYFLEYIVVIEALISFFILESFHASYLLIISLLFFFQYRKRWKGSRGQNRMPLS
jgi:hypothetical protein